MKKKILIEIIVIIVLISAIFIIFTLSKKEKKTTIPVTSDTTTTTLETSEVTTEPTPEPTTSMIEKQTTVTTKKTAIKKTTTTLDYKIIKETQSEESSKYGTIIKENYEISYKVYNDGRKEEKSRKKKNTTIDSTNFKATTNELKAEAESVSTANKNIYNEMLSYVNNYRSEVNVNSLSIDNNLSLAATIRTIEMAYSKKFSHIRPDGTMCYSVVDDLGINVMSSMGENIASGQKSVAAVSEEWKNSSLHYSNMINEGFTKVGFGKYSLNGKIYWVQIFAG